MIKLFFTDKESVYKELESAIARHICGSFVIQRTENGKPYIEGNPIYFSLSHSGGKAVIALCDKPVGADMELFGNKKYKSVLSRFTENEQNEINGSEAGFLKNWTAKEAFIKMLGGTIAGYLKRLEYRDGQIYLDKTPQNANIYTHEYDFGIVTVCTRK
ncbi:MAG: 4'-phosphopantetheinyl transferase superfamily protein [Clostridia bacterium]|nr:4'-phosphopantetheinyl transferase superfamily protein [Clostridia bacterium]